MWSDQDGTRQEVKSKIIDFLLRDGVEYLVAENDLHIHLDSWLSEGYSHPWSKLCGLCN